MASEDPRVKQIEQLAEKQMRSVLHARFLENCKAENIIPKGLCLKLKVNVGDDSYSTELQESIDSLLVKVSGDICERIRECQQRRAHNFGEKMETLRGQLKQKLNDENLFDIDDKIHKITEEKKDILFNKHLKKLTHLKECRDSNNKNLKTKTLGNAQSNDVPKSNRPQKGNKPNKKSDRNRRRKPEEKNTPTESTAGSKMSTTTTKLQSSRSSVSQHNPKNDQTPGPAKTYAEAVKTGATLQETVRNLVKAVTTVAALIEGQNNRSANGDGKDGSSGSRTERHGGKRKEGYRKYGKGKKRS